MPQIKKVANYKEGARRLLNPGHGRDYKVWIKRITGVDRNKPNGFAFEGEFLYVRGYLTENDLDTESPYLIYGEYDTAFGTKIFVCLATFDGVSFNRWGDIVTGPDYALKLRDNAERLLVQTSGFSPQQFILSLHPAQVRALKEHLINSY